MIYNGTEINRITPSEWNGKSTDMLVWNDDSISASIEYVCGYDASNSNGVKWISANNGIIRMWQHCGMLPKWNVGHRYLCSPGGFYPDTKCRLFEYGSDGLFHLTDNYDLYTCRPDEFSHIIEAGEINYELGEEYRCTLLDGSLIVGEFAYVVGTGFCMLDVTEYGKTDKLHKYTEFVKIEKMPDKPQFPKFPIRDMLKKGALYSCTFNEPRGVCVGVEATWDGMYFIVIGNQNGTEDYDIFNPSLFQLFEFDEFSKIEEIIAQKHNEIAD